MSDTIDNSSVIHTALSIYPLYRYPNIVPPVRLPQNVLSISIVSSSIDIEHDIESITTIDMHMHNIHTIDNSTNIIIDNSLSVD